MATSTIKSPSTLVDQRSTFMPIIMPYLVGMATQLPMLLLYVRNLWGKPYYQFFPVAIVAMLAFIYLRWPKGEGALLRNTRLSNGLLGLAVICGLTGVLFVEPWFSATCVVALTGSLLARVLDNESDKSLVNISLLGLICISPPFNLDAVLITKLQQYSAGITSLLLDLVGYAHYMPGTVILAPGTEGFGIEEACSGVQSFFTLLFVAVFFIVFFRRPWFRATMLVLTVIFWAIFMNTLRIFAIPIADRYLNMDLSHGLSHEILGYITLLLGILMIYSSDQFLMFLFGPAEQFGEESHGMLHFVTRFWNLVISGTPNEDRKRKTSQAVNQKTIFIVWSAVGCLVVAGIWNLSDVYRSLSKPEMKIRFFDSTMAVLLAKKSIPETIGNWKQNGYVFEDRSRGSDLGQYSNTWQYQGPNYLASVSVDQPFPGWHELTTCYTNMGWEIVSRRKQTSDDGWSYVVADLRKPTGERGYLAFALFDSFGEPFDAPENWSAVQWLINGASNRMSNRIRGRLFRGEAFQTQVFVVRYADFEEDMKDEIKQRFLEIREIVRKDFLNRRMHENVDTPPEDEKAAAEKTSNRENAKAT